MSTEKSVNELPDFYPYIARDVINFCNARQGNLVDLGCGQGQLAFALAKKCESFLFLVDPDRKALAKAMEKRRGKGFTDRAFTLQGCSENLPLADQSADLVVSRGSIFFWKDQPAGIREVYRVLRPGGKAMLGGGLGSTYPGWARRAFIHRRRQKVREKGPEAVRAFKQVRNRETFIDWARRADLKTFEVHGEAALPDDDPDAGMGIWLLFGKNSR